MNNLKDYVLWISNYMKEHNSIDTYTWQYEESKNENNSKNITLLDKFYFAIENYANMNHMYPESYDYRESYKVMINNVGYEVGVDTLQGTLFYIKKTKDTDLTKYINIENVINNVKKPGVDNINDRLSNLSNRIINMYEDGVPIESIKRVIDSTIEDIEKNKSNGSARTHKIDY